MTTTKKESSVLGKKMCFRLDSDRAGQLERYSSSEGFPVSQVIRHLVCRFLDSQRPVFISSAIRLEGGDK